MATQTIVQSVNQTLRDEMRRNGNMVILGEDVGKNGGVFRATEGLLDEFGGERVVDTPLAEDAIVGMAIGMALYGLQPVVEIQFMDFIYPAFNEIVSELAKLRYRSGGQYQARVVIRTPYGGGVKGGHYHSQSTEAYFIHTPGLVVLAPSTPYDTKGLLISAMRSPDPVIFLEPKRIYRTVEGGGARRGIHDSDWQGEDCPGRKRRHPRELGRHGPNLQGGRIPRCQGEP